MLDALRRAVDLYNKPEEWAKLRRNAMTYDFSWSKSAKMYLEMYADLF
jgi:starch synthase